MCVKIHQSLAQWKFYHEKKTRKLEKEVLGSERMAAPSRMSVASGFKHVSLWHELQGDV